MAALAIGALACLALAGCGAKPGTSASVSTPEDAVATPVATVESATPAPTVAAATAAAPAPAFSASWLREATPWSGFQTQAAPSTGAFFSAASTNGDLLAGWQVFVSQEGGFSVRLPGDPAPGVQTVPTAAGTLTLHTFLYQNESSGYYVGYADYPAGLVQGANTKRLLDGARDGAVAMVHGTLLSEQDVTLAGMPARQVVIQAPYPGSLQTIVVTARFGMAGNRQYQLQALSAGTPTAAGKARIEAFFDSFRLTP
jgi:hypothetical protein